MPIAPPMNLNMPVSSISCNRTTHEYEGRSTRTTSHHMAERGNHCFAYPSPHIRRNWPVSSGWGHGGPFVGSDTKKTTITKQKTSPRSTLAEPRSIFDASFGPPVKGFPQFSGRAKGKAIAPSPVAPSSNSAQTIWGSLLQ